MPSPAYREQFALAFAFLLVAVPFAVVLIGYLYDRFSLMSTIGAAVSVLLGPVLGWGAWHHPTPLVVLFLHLSMIGIAAYMVFRSRWSGLSRHVAAVQGALSGPLTFALCVVLHCGMPVAGTQWFLSFLSLGVLAALVVGFAGWAWRLLIQVSGDVLSVYPEDAQGAATTEERHMVLQMVADGKVSAEEAEQLLEAVGDDRRPGDRLPVGRSELATIAGAMAVIVGFMLPWAYVSIGGTLPSAALQGIGNMPWPASRHVLHRAYQAGHHVGFLGYLILALGLLPALLVCLPALDRHLRQGMLRFVVAATGGAFVVSLVARCPQGIGLWVCLVGFGVQILSALRQAGMWQQAQGGKPG